MEPSDSPEAYVSAETRPPAERTAVAPDNATRSAAEPRWSGKTGRLEVWYATFTEQSTGAAGWIHYETVAPTSPDKSPYNHGWIAWFGADGAERASTAGAAPIVERFGPTPASPSRGRGEWFTADEASLGPRHLTGRTATMSWDLTWSDPSEPMWTFPRLAWEHGLLPASQVVIAPTARFVGSVTVDGHALAIDARGGLSHIFGHGNAQRWAWLHADLGDGEVLEAVTAVSRRPPLHRLPPLAFLQLRTGSGDWPAIGGPLLRVRSEISLPTWTLSGGIGSRRIEARVHLRPRRSVELSYADPDGAGAVCTNSEQADLELSVDRRRGLRGWERERSWRLSGTAHAEVGVRP